jgi:hypothetical protein
MYGSKKFAICFASILHPFSICPVQPMISIIATGLWTPDYARMFMSGIFFTVTSSPNMINPKCDHQC